MGKTKTETEQDINIKEPRTIKVRTVVITLAIITALIAGMISGYFLSIGIINGQKAQVYAQAKEMTNELLKQDEQK